MTKYNIIINKFALEIFYGVLLFMEHGKIIVCLFSFHAFFFPTLIYNIYYRKDTFPVLTLLP